MDFVPPLLFMAAFAGVFGWLIVRSRRELKRQRADLEALATREGWTLETQAEGRRKVTLVRPQAGGWMLKLATGYSSGSSKSRTTVPGYSEFRADVPAWADGVAIFSQKLPLGFDQLRGGSGMVGFFQNAAFKALMGRILDPDTLREVERLEPFDPPPGIELSILATEDPRGGNLRAIHDAIQGWAPKRSRARDLPAVHIDRAGTTLRLPTQLAETEDIAAFLAHGQQLAEALR